MTKAKAIDLIDSYLGPAVVETLLDGQADGSDPQWQYDETLIKDIGEAVEKWKSRKMEKAT